MLHIQNQNKNIEVLLLTGVTHPVSFNRAQGAYRLASQLRSLGVATRVIDSLGSTSPDQVIQMIRAVTCKNPQLKIVGFSTSFFANLNSLIHEDSLVTNDFLPYPYDQWMQIIEAIQQTTNAKIIVGGHKASEFEKDLVRHPYIDHIVYGYADTSILKILQGRSSEKILTELTPDASFSFQELSQRYERQDSFLPGESFTVEMHRGCIFRCLFCAYPLNGKKAGAWARDVELFVDELEHCNLEFGSSNFIISCDTFNENYEYLHKLSSTLKRRGLTFNFGINARIDLFRNREIIDLMPDLGVRTILFGLESTNLESLALIKKSTPFEKVDKILHECKKSWGQRIKVTGSYIVGLPHDRPENIEKVFAYFSDSNCPLDGIEFDPLYVTNKATDKNPWKSEFTLFPEKHGFYFASKSNDRWVNNLTPYGSFDETVRQVDLLISRLPTEKRRTIKSAAYLHLPNNFNHEAPSAQRFEDAFACGNYEQYDKMLKTLHGTSIEDSKRKTVDLYFKKFMSLND